MLTYVSAQQVNQAYWTKFQDKPFADEWSRMIIKKLLEQYCKDKYRSIYEAKGNICYDLKLTMTNKTHTAIEIKFRSDLSTKYPSHLINMDKYAGLVEKANKGIIESAYLTTIWYDGVIHISNVFGEHMVEEHWQNKTTNVSDFTDGKKVLKQCACYQKQVEFYFCYECDPETGALSPYFSREPINIAKLNYEAKQTKSIPLF